MTEKYRTVTNAIITYKGKILIGKKEERQDHPISGQWHLPGGHIDKGEEPEETIKREIKEETGLDVEVHQLVDVTSQAWNNDKVMQITFHCEAENNNAKAKDDIDEIKWIEPGQVNSQAGKFTEKNIEERKELKKFIKRIEKAPY